MFYADVTPTWRLQPTGAFDCLGSKKKQISGCCSYMVLGSWDVVNTVAQLCDVWYWLILWSLSVWRMTAASSIGCFLCRCFCCDLYQAWMIDKASQKQVFWMTSYGTQKSCKSREIDWKLMESEKQSDPKQMPMHMHSSSNWHSSSSALEHPWACIKVSRSTCRAQLI